MSRDELIGLTVRVLRALALLSLAACANDGGVVEPPSAARVELSAVKTRVEVGEPLAITAVARDARDSVIANPAVVWNASPAAIATIANGVLTASAPGTVVVQATVQSASASIAVNVVSPAAARILVFTLTQTIAVGSSVPVSALVLDARQAQLSDRVVSWSSSDPRLVVSSAGIATAYAPGKAYVVASSDGVRDSLLFTITGTGATTLVVSPETVELPRGRTRILSARLRDETGTLTVPGAVTWSSENPQVAAVSNGVVTGLAVGSTVVRAQFGALTAFATVRIGSGGVVYAVGTATTTERVIRADSIDISGTLTASGPLTLVSSGDIVVTGDVVVPCYPLTLLAGGRLIITHATFTSLKGLNNICPTTPPGPAPGIAIEAAGGYRLVWSWIQSSGNIAITNDAGLVAADFTSGPRDRASEVCALANSTIWQPSLPASADGVAGRDGARIEVDCRGRLSTSVASIVANGATSGGNSTQPTSARGLDGGRSGTLRFRVTGDVIVNERRLNFRIQAPGNGGSATATEAGADGANVTAIGGRGGDVGAPGLPPIELRVAGDVIDADPALGNVIELGIFISGRGGDATANASRGRDATAQAPAGAGGAATALAGSGGTVYPSIVSIGGALPEGALSFLGQPAGAGGTATAVGGNGGAGSSEFPNGGPGGAVRAEGGDGGVALGVNTRDGSPASGGLGGKSSLGGGNGGTGFDQCGSTGASGVSGNGGAGGTLSGFDGHGGTGQSNGIPLGITISGAANGGAGGRGAMPGLGGRAGNDSTQARGPRVVTPPSFLNGAIGGACPTP